ncbi:flippase [Blautia massiliensis (ex Liu et al. 2021)]|jgi:O-antigen/teichoic acid export membrane protein|uniref:flippase n=1 Tax=Blautia massiliensis (ex Liu et al. 2021) TaxID=3062492 RepID=UPI003F8ACCD0
MSQKQKSLKLNFIMNAFLTMSSFIFPLITFPYVSRVLSPVGMGKVSFATSLISYFQMFAQLGIPTYGIRACAKVRDNREELTRTVHELLMLNLIMDLISYTFLTIILILNQKIYEERLLYIILSMTIFLSTIGVEWLYKAMEEYSYITIRSIIFKIIAIFAMFMLIRDQNDYTIYGFITIFASSASNILNFINMHKYIDMKFMGNYNLKRHLKPVAVFFAMACATTIYTNLDTVMLGFMTTDADVGYYNAAIKIKTILVSIVTSLGTVLLPRASYYVEQGLFENFKQIGKKALNFVVIIAIPLMVYFILFAKETICFLTGTDYMEAIIPMQLIMPTLVLIGITNILGIQILIPLGREKIVLCSEIIGAVIDLIINWILIPLIASSGAAIGTMFAEFSVLIVQYVALKKDVNYIFKSTHILKIIISTIIAGILSVPIKYLECGNLITLIISAGAFFGIYSFILILTKETLVVELLKQAYNRVKR